MKEAQEAGGDHLFGICGVIFQQAPPSNNNNDNNNKVCKKNDNNNDIFPFF